MRIACRLLALLALSVVLPTTARRLQKNDKDNGIPIRTDSPTFSPTRSPSLAPTRSPSLAPTRSPSLAPTRSPSLAPTSSPNTPAPPPPTVTNIYDTNQQTIPISAFTLRLVVPSQTRRRLQAPYNLDVLLTVTQDHISNYLMGELNKNVDDVKLSYVKPSQVTFLQSSTAVMEEMSGYVLMDGAPSSNTVNAIVLQSLEGQALWELFFKLRESGDPVLAKLQQVTLVDTSETSAPQDGGVSPLVIGILVGTGTLTILILAYMCFLARTNDSEIQPKNDSGTPETTTSPQFFPAQNQSTRESTGTFRNFARNDDALSVNSGQISMVSSALHSIRETSMEDDEEEDGKEMPGNSRLWDTLSEIEVQEESIIENTPPMIPQLNETFENADYFCIQKIMAIETTYSTEQGMEVARREFGVAPKPKKKGNWFNNWRMRRDLWRSMNDSQSQCSF